MFGAGVDPLGEVLAAVRSLVAGFEVDGLDAPEAAEVVDQCAEAERLLGALRASTAGRAGRDLTRITERGVVVVRSTQSAEPSYSEGGM